VQILSRRGLAAQKSFPPCRIPMPRNLNELHIDLPAKFLGLNQPKFFGFQLHSLHCANDAAAAFSVEDGQRIGLLMASLVIFTQEKYPSRQEFLGENLVHFPEANQPAREKDGIILGDFHGNLLTGIQSGANVPE